MNTNELMQAANFYKQKADEYLKKAIASRDLETTYYAEEHIRYKNKWTTILALLK